MPQQFQKTKKNIAEHTCTLSRTREVNVSIDPPNFKK